MKTNKKKFIGVVISDKMDKTVVVKVERNKMHPKYKKVVKTYKKFYAHDENNEASEGDKVLIIESRPLSKLKRWVVIKVLEKAQNV
ncbi:MAG: 30S ribosomal protein S17 [Candidatus Calescibacterium sp.]|nr:30S ribosomal protein S17 [Candidatus Calescibacterium sp.]MDW8132837.1 30S ribosomal protein S17 [Candidatus Calescibacterium sp.]